MKKATYKTCEKGHFFASNFSVCPYCNPSKSDKEDSESSKHSKATEMTRLIVDDDKTRIIQKGGAQKDDDKTTIVSDLEKRKQYSSEDPSHSSKTRSKTEKIDSGDQTTIIRNPKATSEPDRTIIVGRAQSRKSRKLVGWLVSYTLASDGIDFKIFEGKNQIGRDSQADIRITEDPSVSSSHGTIFYRTGKFYFRDEFSSNPSYINGEEVFPENTTPIKDGDKIKIGANIFLFRTAEME